MKKVAKITAFLITIYALMISAGTVVLAIFYNLMGYGLGSLFTDGVKVGTVAFMIIIAAKYFKDKKKGVIPQNREVPAKS